MQSRAWHFILWSSQLGILGLAFNNPKPSILGLSFLSIALAGLVAWIYSVRQTRIIADTPLSTIASAAQGYVKLKGIASPKPEYTVVATGGLPCIWFRCICYRNAGEGWEEFNRVISDSIFEINDNSGEACMVNPEQAEIVTADRNVWYSDNYKYAEELLFPGQQLYVTGEFSTLKADAGLRELNTDVSRLLAEWKKNKPALLERFDKNRDGKIDLEEWETARQEAYRQINLQTGTLDNQPDLHIISNPENGRPFVITNLPEKKLRRRSLLFAWTHLAVFFAGLYGAFWIMAKFGTLH